MEGFIDDYVLYADDDEDDREFLGESFKLLIKNKTLVTVKNGLELIDYLDQHAARKGLPCLIVLDQNMPGLNGDEAVKRLKAGSKYETIPVVMFSTSDYVPALNEIPVGFVLKPSSLEGWKNIALKLLEHCNDFKAENTENK